MFGDQVLGAVGQSRKQASGSAIFAIALCNALEWYEIVIYGYLAVIISRLFFPTESASASLLLAFASFGVTFIARPLGAVFLGSFADRRGRKPALQLSIWMMLIGSATIVFVPTYEAIGILAPIIVVLARFLQGFSVGGEFGSATAFLAEQSSARRGYYASWQFASQGLTALLATSVGAALTWFFSTEQLYAWAWRLPFFFGLLILPVGIYIRSNVAETAEFAAIRKARSPLRAAVLDRWRSFLISLGVVVLGTVAVYTILFMPTYAVRQLALTPTDGFAAGMVAGALQVFLVPVFGALSDRVGRTLVPIVAASIILAGIYPAFAWLNVEPSLAKLLLIQCFLGTITAAYIGALPALMSELFPAEARTSGLSISYSLGVAVFGGFAPFIHAWLILTTQTSHAPSYYVVAAAIISLIALLAARRMGFR